MKMVTAVIKSFKLTDVKNALEAHGISGMTITEVKGYGQQKGQSEEYRGAEYTVEFVPKTKVEVLVTNDQATPVAELIADAATTGSIGDGKIWVTEVVELMRVRTRETGNAAV